MLKGNCSGQNVVTGELQYEKRFVTRITVTFRPLRRTVIPPFTAKVTKTILHRISKLYRKLNECEAHFKPVSVSPLYRGDKALFKSKGSQDLMMLEEGAYYSFSASIISDETTNIDEIVSLDSSTVDGIYGSQVSIESIKVEIKDFEQFGFEKPSAIKLSFESPVLLQLPSKRRYMSNRHFLFPIPSLMIGSLIEHWNRYCPSSMFIKNPYYLSVYSNYVLREADFEIKPVTVLYDESRHIRGFLGWVLYDLRAARYTSSLRKIFALLDYAQYVGIGRSRATGFGQLKLKFYY